MTMTIAMAITYKKVGKLLEVQRAMECTMLGISLKDRVRNEHRRLTKVKNVIQKARKNGSKQGMWLQEIKGIEQLE